MLSLYGVGDKGLEVMAPEASGALPPQVVWIDLVTPTIDEEHAVQNWLDIEVPTREEMREIEISSRLYEERGSIYMTASIIVNADGSFPETTEVTFILSHGRVVTVRYADPRPFMIYVQRVNKQLVNCSRGEQVFLGLVDAIVDRLADLLERAGSEIDQVSNLVFRRRQDGRKRVMRTRDFDVVIEQIGQTGDLTSKVRESLVTIARLVSYLSGAEGLSTEKLPRDVKPHLKTAQRDVQQLTDHASYLSDKIAFLMDATTGFITIDQNNIIKLFSVVSVALMPPTLIASIYGMNFDYMPELAQIWGYPAALVAMVISAVVPLVYFRRRGWL